MARTILVWRYGAAPNYTFAKLFDYEAPPAADAVIVDKITEATQEIRQERKTPGHYGPMKVSFAVPAGKARYWDLVVPDFTNGIDPMGVHFYAGDVDSGDEIVAGKLLAGAVGTVIQDAAQDATVVKVRSQIGVLAPTLKGGVLDEGFYASFGTENSTADAINTADPTADFDNPAPELKEYRIKRIATPTVVGGGYEDVDLTFLTGLAAPVTAGTSANLVVRFVPEILEVTKGQLYGLGLETLSAGNFPPNSRVRLGFRNVVGGASKTVRAVLAALY